MSKTYAEIKAEQFATFNKMGEHQVRLLLAAGRYSGTKLHWATEWLGEIEGENQRRSEASNSESLRIARSAKNAAWAAVIMAAAAAAIAAVSMLISYLAFRASGP